ncbi:MAG: methionine--tRNA ligase subunit beta, partial [Cyclobacteriaceae bacterium]
NVYGQCKSWLDQGLKPRAMTRDLDWGIPVPLPDAEGKVLYVWFDAPIGYISATKEWAQENQGDWEPYWKDQDTKLVHFIGKDNIVFHCIIFPVLLKAHGAYILPDNVPANEFLNLEGGKVSTSRNWAVWLHEYLEAFPNKQDVLRYTLCAIAPETKDSDFTWKDFQARNNNELVAILGNFINRTLVLTKKYYQGTVPEKGKLQPVDETLIDQVSQAPKDIANAIEHYKFREAQSLMMEVARWGNKYLADNEPWKLIKTNPERVQTIMNISLQLAANLTILTGPFLPFSSEKLRGMINLQSSLWESAGKFDLLNTGHQLAEPELLFEKIEDPMIQKQIDKLEATKDVVSDTDLAPAKETITYDDFIKMDVRIGTIKAAERVPKSKKLLKLEVATGLDTRTVVSGIAEHYSPEEIIDQQVTVLLNLAPRKIMGIESQGMILMAENQEGELAFLEPDKEINDGGLVS